MNIRHVLNRWRRALRLALGRGAPAAASDSYWVAVDGNRVRHSQDGIAWKDGSPWKGEA